MVAVLWRCRCARLFLGGGGGGVACGPTGVAGAGGPGRGAGLLGVPVGGGPPASRPRRELRSARRLEARPGPAAAHGHRSQALRSLRRPPHQWCQVADVARRVVSKPGQALPPPTGTAARPAGPSGALHTNGAGSLMCGSARQDRRLGRWSLSDPERNIAPADCSSAWHASAVKETSPLLG